MPGLDHPVHELTIGGNLYGCHNRLPFVDGYYAPDRDYLPDGRWFDNIKFVKHRMSIECRYDMSLKDAKCLECKHRGSGEEYDQRIRREGT